jgi:hypothetical protein
MTPGLRESADPAVLIPGDPAGLRSLADQWASHASAATAVSSDYRAATASSWEGAGADAYELLRDRQASRASAAGTAYNEASAALAAHAFELDAGRRTAARAVAEWTRGLGVTSTARLAHDEAAARARANPYALAEVSVFVDPGVAIRDNAEALLDDARTAVAASEAATVRTLDALAGRAFTDSLFGDLAPPADLAEVMAQAGEKQLLRDLRRLSPGALAAYAAAHPDLLDRLLRLGPAHIAAWWKNLDPAVRERLAASLPRVIGNLDGVDARTRSAVNARTLDADIAATEARIEQATKLLESPDPGTRAAARAMIDSENAFLTELQTIRKAFGAGPGGTPPRQLYAYSPGDRTKVAISTGLIDDAEHVTVLVPGMGTTALDVGKYGQAATDLRELQAQLSGLDTSSIAVISWIDYDPPGSIDVWGVTHNELAQAGADRLVSTMQGLQAVNGWSSQPPQLSVVAHSYGTNVAAQALARPGASAGSLVLLGSAGVSGGAPVAGALNVLNGQVYATQAVADEWAPIGQLLSGRQDPTSFGYGAHVFSSESTTIDGQKLEGVTSHGPFGGSGGTSYLDDQSSAQYATAQATMGKGSEIPFGGTPLDRFGVRSGKR